MTDRGNTGADLFEQISTPIQIYRVDCAKDAGTSQFLAANPAALRLFGPPAKVDAPLDEAFPALRGAGLAELCERVARSGEPESIAEIRISKNDGKNDPSSSSAKPTFLRASAFPLDEGRVGLALDDITAMKEAHAKEIRRERALFQATIDCVPEAIFVKSAVDHTYVIANQTCAPLSGGTLEALVGKRNIDVFPPNAAVAFEEIDKKVIAGGKPVSFEENVPVPDGIRVSMTTKTPVFDEDGHPAYLIGFSKDVTQQKKHAEELQKSHAALDETQTTLRETIRELSTPVLPIHDGVLVVPLVGHMDSQRSAQLTEALLGAIQRHRAAAVIIDITGVEMVDTAVASHLIQTCRASALLGSASILVGIAPQIAQTLVQIGVDFGAVITCRDLQAGVAHALDLIERGRDRG